MKKTIIALALCGIIAQPAYASNAVRVFPPDGCASGVSMLLTWDVDHNVACNPVPTCTAGQTLSVSNVLVNNVPRIFMQCINSLPTPPVCTGSNVLQFDGTKFLCTSIVNSGMTGGGSNTDTQHDNGHDLQNQHVD
jgi:hypothetical protein